MSKIMNREVTDFEDFYLTSGSRYSPPSMILKGTPETRSQHSGNVGSSFDGVVMDKDTPIEQRRVLAYICREHMDFVAKIGWYEHTADWDQHAEIHTYEGLWTHNDGVAIELYPSPDDLEYAREDKGVTHIDLLDCNLWDETDEAEKRFFEKYGRNQRGDTYDLRIPLEDIAEIRLGWC